MPTGVSAPPPDEASAQGPIEKEDIPSVQSVHSVAIPADPECPPTVGSEQCAQIGETKVRNIH